MSVLIMSFFRGKLLIPPSRSRKNFGSHSRGFSVSNRHLPSNGSLTSLPVSTVLPLKFYHPLIR